MSEHDEIRVKIDPVQLQRSVSIVGPDGQTFTLRRERSEGELCERRTVKLGKVTYGSIMSYLLNLYADTLFSPEYLFLNEEDYSALHKDDYTAYVSRYGMAEHLSKYGRLVKFASPATGKYMHLATLPNLQEGEIMVLYEYK